jgi:BirA family transcriptional regulator, biotin operon repressor / biotin---[acetyl-CoA-carboxylase] ligase
MATHNINISQITQSWAKARGITTEYFETVDSTNSVAKDNAFAETELENNIVLYLADQQTQGRGRFDRTWITAGSGNQLLFSWSFLIDQAPLPQTTARVGLALINALKSTWNFIPFQIKAPNDLFVNDKKMAGILVETVSQGDEHRLIIGIGLNVLQYPKELSTSTSLLNSLTAATPLSGEDWILFLDRLLFEMTSLVPQAHLDLSSTEQFNFLNQLNHEYKNFNEINWDL